MNEQKKLIGYTGNYYSCMLPNPTDMNKIENLSNTVMSSPLYIHVFDFSFWTHYCKIQSQSPPEELQKDSTNKRVAIKKKSLKQYIACLIK